MKRTNLILVICAVLLSAWPLVTLKKRGDAELFTGADGKAQEVVSTLSPTYVPWARPLMEPPGNEVESLLFSLQAAAGAALLGYWYGCARTRRRYESAGRGAPGA